MAKRIRTKYTLRSDGRICLTCNIGGTRKYFYGSSDAEVEAKRDAAVAAYNAAPRCRTFEQVADAWWEHKEAEISPNTVRGYKSCKNRAVEEFGDYLVSDITPQLIIQSLRRLSAQGYSSKVLSNYKSVLHCILDEAFADGDIDRNPATALPLVKGSPKQPRQAAAASDIAKLEEHKLDSMPGRMMYFILFTGLRRGEACALQWKDIDTNSNTVTVRQNLAYKENDPIIKLPKTAAGVRTVPLIPKAASVLPDRGPEEGYVFFPDGLPRRNAYDRFIDDFMEEHGIHSTCHQLRHSYSSLLFDAGFSPKEMQATLGHANISVTMDIYTHLQAQHRADMTSRLADYTEKQKTT